MTTEEVVERFADARPGFVLASYAEVGLPYYRIRLRLQVLEHKAVGPLEEYSLRAVAAGITDPANMQQALGLDANVVQATIVALVEREALSIEHTDETADESLGLTPRGEDLLADAVQVVSSERIVDIDFDGLLREPTPFLSQYLEPRQLGERGIREVPPHPARRPDEVELRTHVASIEEIARQAGGPRQQLSDVLAVRGIERRLRIFQPAIALVYRAEGSRRSQGQVVFAVGGQLSERHAQVFAEAGLGRKLGIAKRGIEDARTMASRILGPELVEQLDAPTVSAESQPAAVAAGGGTGVRTVQTYEHPAILSEALGTSRERLLLVSPWLRRAVVNATFLAKLEGALKRGVKVYLGWGMSASEAASPDADQDVLASLSDLSRQHEQFHFKRLGRTHAKVLICDRRFVVVTSFNWLSFKGDPKRTFRDERGTMVAIEAHVDEQFDSLSPRFG